MGLVDFAGGVSGRLQQMLMERELQRRQQMQEQQQAQQMQMQQSRLGLDQERMGLDTFRAGEEARQFDVGREDKASAAAKEQEGFGLYLNSVPAHLKPVVEAKKWGINVGVHDAEDPAAHSAHMATENQAVDARRLGVHEGEAQIDARYRAPQREERERTVQIMGPNGVPIWVKESDAIGKPAAQAPRAVTGGERQTLSYYNRAKQATDDIAPLEDEIANKGLAGQARLQMMPNFMQSDTNQSYRQAQRAFTEARLRKESGAAIPTGEYENDAKTYFAQPGDSPATLDQKRRARAVVLDGMKNSSGKAYDEYYGDRPSGPTQSNGIKILSVEEVP